MTTRNVPRAAVPGLALTAVLLTGCDQKPVDPCENWQMPKVATTTYEANGAACSGSVDRRKCLEDKERDKRCLTESLGPEAWTIEETA